eukprot:6865346-Prymnesium_polylepis.1
MLPHAQNERRLLQDAPGVHVERDLDPLGLETVRVRPAALNLLHLPLGIEQRFQLVDVRVEDGLVQARVAVDAVTLDTIHRGQDGARSCECVSEEPPETLKPNHDSSNCGPLSGRQT